MQKLNIIQDDVFAWLVTKISAAHPSIRILYIKNGIQNK